MPQIFHTKGGGVAKTERRLRPLRQPWPWTAPQVHRAPPGVLGRSSARRNLGPRRGKRAFAYSVAPGVQSEVVMKLSVVGGRHIRAFEGSASKRGVKNLLCHGGDKFSQVRVGISGSYDMCTHTYAQTNQQSKNRRRRKRVLVPLDCVSSIRFNVQREFP